MPERREAPRLSSPQSPIAMMHHSLPDEVTGSRQISRRGWNWWILRRITWLLFLVFRGRKHGRLVLDRLRGVPLVVFPGVFHPGLFFSTPLLLDALDQLELKMGSHVLDLGTGTGVCAIFAAKKGAQVTATDISPIAVRCARVNVVINCLDDQVRVLEGDLFRPVRKKRFDLIIFNPPYYEGKPRTWYEYAWQGQKVLDRFAEGLGVHLAEGGRALISVSTELDIAAVKEQLRENGFELRERRRRRLPGETMFVYECIPSSASVPVRSEGLGTTMQRTWLPAQDLPQ